MATQIETFISDNVYMILAALVTGFGFGPVRLRRFMDHYDKMVRRMKEFYECSTDDIAGPCESIVKRAGFDLQAWEDEKNQQQAKTAMQAMQDIKDTLLDINMKAAGIDIKAGDTIDKQRVAQIHPVGYGAGRGPSADQRAAT